MAIGYLRRYFRRLSDNTVYEVLIRLQREFVHSEDWRAFQAHQAGRTWVLIEERKEQAGESMYTGIDQSRKSLSV